MKVRFTARAKADLDEIIAWIAKDNPRRGLTFALELRAKCRGLGDEPEAYPVIGRGYGADVRRRAHRGYLILYRVSDVVEVLRVLNGARSVDSLLNTLR